MALELVGGALLSAFLQVAFDKLASPQVSNFFSGRKLDENLLSKLEIKLQSIHALADDAEQKQFTDPHVRNWLFKVKDVVLDAEDVLDEIQYELLKCEVESESKSESQTSTSCTCKVPNFFKSLSNNFFKEIRSRMEKVLDSLEFLCSQKGDLGLRNVSVGVGVGSGLGGEVSQKLSSTSLMVESVIYGRDDDKEMIINWLTTDTDNPNKLSILSIVGMGGLGKTMLTQHVYHDPRIERKFDIKAWVCVSDDFNVFNLTRTILEAITKSTDDSRNREMVQGRLKEKLSGKRFLLVLDDVWNRKQKEWKDLKTPLNDVAQGSKILVTTRDTKVASSMQSDKIHPLKLLQGDHCWQLFAKHAFQDDNPQPSRDCKEIGMKIVEKCNGLPLALTTIGSLLHQKSSISEWKSILKNEIWEFSEDDSDIIPALRLSYHHLPPHLKRCFAYSAIFPKDYMFDKKWLIQLWMAEDFLQCRQQHKSLKEVGEQYFSELLSRSFFQQSSFRGKTCFVMHDLLNDLAKYVCGDFCFRLEDDQAKTMPKVTRHFSVAINHVKYFNGFGVVSNTRRFHTFLPTCERMNSFGDRWHCKMSMRELFSMFKFLHVLSLANCSNLTVVPDSIRNLKHLRSLDLSGTDIYKLPESACSLYNLQILKLNGIPFIELPLNLYKLTNLHFLELIKTKVENMPLHLGKLKNLEVSMSSFYVGSKREFSMQQLGELNLQGQLSIVGLEKVVNPSDVLAVDLKNKAHLVGLELIWSRFGYPDDDSKKERDETVIENLQPSQQLEKLLIRNYRGKKFPRWLSHNSLCNVVSLMLMNCQSCQHLPSLGLLPFLKHLTIEELDGIVSIGTDFYGSSSSSFSSLETLRFYSMKAWKKWECQAVTGAFPRLQHLCLDRCPELKGQLSIQLAHLKTVYIGCCKRLLGCSGTLQSDGKNLDIHIHEMEAWLVELIDQMISCTSHDYLHISYSPNMNIPMSPCYNFLVTLKIHDSCDSLTTVPLDFFPALQLLSLYGCKNLQRISQRHGVAHNRLKDLTIWKCPQFESLPEGMHILPSLYKLMIRDCPKLESFPDGGLPSNLATMDLNNCSKLITSMKGTLGANPTLKTLWIGKLDTESFPDEGLLPHSLNCLWIIDCPNLKKLDYEGLCHLSSLETVVLQNCPSLQCLPEGLCNLPSLEKLVVQECRSLQCLPEGLRHLSSLKKLVLRNCPVSNV